MLNMWCYPKVGIATIKLLQAIPHSCVKGKTNLLAWLISFRRFPRHNYFYQMGLSTAGDNYLRKRLLFSGAEVDVCSLWVQRSLSSQKDTLGVFKPCLLTGHFVDGCLKRGGKQAKCWRDMHQTVDKTAQWLGPPPLTKADMKYDRQGCLNMAAHDQAEWQGWGRGVAQSLAQQ